MSQGGANNVVGSGGQPIETITGNTGGPVGPDGANNINLIGNSATGIEINGNPALNTLTVAADAATTSQRGTLTLATNAETIAGLVTTKAITPDDLTAKLGTQTVHGVAVGAGTSSAIAWTGTGTAGQVLTSNGPALDPTFQSIAADGAIISITGNSGGAEVPDAGGNFNILGTGSITVTGSANTETVQLTGLTNHAVLIGAGTATITKVGPIAATGAVLQSNGLVSDPGFSTATYPSTTTINQILYSSAANTVTGLATANRAVFTTSSAGVPVATALAADGQLIIGSTAGAPAAATLSAGSGISIANGSNSITITNTLSTGGGLIWTDVTGATQTVAAGNGYLADNAGGVAFTLPASGTIGDVFRIVGVQGSWTLAQAAGQQIKFGSTATTVGVTGSLASTNAGDCVECVATNTSASTVWRVMSSVGNITVA